MGKIKTTFKKYLKTAKIGWQKRIQYRRQFFLWRLQKLVFLLTLYFLWTNVFPSSGSGPGFNREGIIQYILLSNLFSSFIFFYNHDKIADDIARGRISNTLIKPINYLIQQASAGFSKRIFNILESGIETIILFLIFKPGDLQGFIPTANQFLAGIGSLILAAGLFSLLDFSIGLIAFWTQRAYGPRFVFRQVIEFSAGRILPLSILPPALAGVFQKLPFSYTLFFPLQIWLGQLNNYQIVTGLITQALWVVVAFCVMKLLWEKGVKAYEAVGG